MTPVAFTVAMTVRAKLLAPTGAYTSETGEKQQHATPASSAVDPITASGSMVATREPLSYSERRSKFRLIENQLARGCDFVRNTVISTTEFTDCL